MNDEAVYRTIPATPALLNRFYKSQGVNTEKMSIQAVCLINSFCYCGIFIGKFS